MTQGREIIREYDLKFKESADTALLDEANKKLCDMAKKQTISTLNAVLRDASMHMKNGFNRADN
jgi:dipeptidase